MSTSTLNNLPVCSDDRSWTGSLRPALEKLRALQLRDGSLYCTLRAFVPVPVFAFLSLQSGASTRAGMSVSFLEQVITVRHLLLALAIAALWNLWFALWTFHDRQTLRKELIAEFLRTFFGAAACGVSFLGLTLLGARYPAGTMHVGGVIGGLIALSWTLIIAFALVGMISPRVRRSRAALIVGSGPLSAVLRERIKGGYVRFHLYGCVDDQYVGCDAQSDKYLGGLDRLEALLKEHPIETVLIGLPIKSKYDQIQQVIQVCETVGVESHCMQDTFETCHARVQSHPAAPPHFTIWTTNTWKSRWILKRTIDFAGSLALLAILCPVMLIAATAIVVSSPGPLFFVQQRFGLHRKRFPMFKFRSMVADAEQLQPHLEALNEAPGPVFKLKKDPRVTRVGAFLRRTSIDELPQLFNVLRGEMSLVGPRPLPIRDVSLFEDNWLLRRFSVPPGLTCLWQINGRSHVSFDQWIKQDLEYIDHWSLALDMKILLLTVPAVLRGSGAM